VTGSSAAPFATTRPKVAISQQPTNEDRPKKWGVLGDFVFFFVNRGTKPTEFVEGPFTLLLEENF